MNLSTGISQSLGVSQQLNLAPQLLQWLKLLQMPTTDLYSVVQQELEINPTLEIEELAAADDMAESGTSADAEAADPQETNFDDKDLSDKYEMLKEMDSDWATGEDVHCVRNVERDDKHDFMINSITAAVTLQDHLLGQLQSARPAPEMKHLASLVVGSLDRRGYLTGTIGELAEMGGVGEIKITAALQLVQSFDPSGVGARDLRECLLLQLEDRDSLPARIVESYLDALGRRQYGEIAAELQVDESEVMSALEQIRALNPEPGMQFGNDRTHYIKADVILHRDGAGYVIELNDKYMPRLRIAPYCRDMLDKGVVKGSDSSYLRKKIRTSSFLIQGIRQRQETLRKVAVAILHYQREYIDREDGVLKPLTMAQVAADINVHETTVSRALANKYIQTPRGLFEMKHFFRAGYQSEDGSAMIAAEVKELISRLVDSEPPARPLTDMEIAERVGENGIKLARRTVAKYREELGIASSKERQFHLRRPTVRLASSEPETLESAPVTLKAMLA